MFAMPNRSGANCYCTMNAVCNTRKLHRRHTPKTIFVGRLTSNMTVQEIETIFTKYGNVISVKVVKNRGLTKGYGFVTFETEEQAANVIWAQEIVHKKRILDVAPAFRKQPKSSYGRGGNSYGLGYYPSAEVSQQDAYTQAAAANAHAYSGYPYMYAGNVVAAAQAMYATPQQFSHQAMQPQSSIVATPPNL